jgi:hypothetical protein
MPSERPKPSDGIFSLQIRIAENFYLYLRTVSQTKLKTRRMKKLIIMAVLIMANLSILSAQQLFFETYSGYGFTAFDLPEIKQGNFVPLGFRLAGGFEHVQFGGEYNTWVGSAELESTFDGQDFRADYKQSYYGGLARVNISSLPAYRVGLVLRFGAGVYNMEREVVSLPDEAIVSPKIDFDSQFGFTGGIGVSAPIYTLLHWELGYNFNYVKWDEQSGVPEAYNGFSHVINIGLSLNLVFGNTAKECRRVITTRRKR